MDGGYDDGYSACTCFWGRQPGSFVKALSRAVKTVSGMRILDLGCGDGKNAVYLARLGGLVDAVDISRIAIQRALAAWPNAPNIVWEERDVVTMKLQEKHYDAIVAYGLLHCLASTDIVTDTLNRMQAATVPGGYNVIATFNSRRQELSAHPNLKPCLLPHPFYLSVYKGWDVLVESDSDLSETHPHNNIPHTHSMTRILAQKPFEP